MREYDDGIDIDPYNMIEIDSIELINATKDEIKEKAIEMAINNGETNFFYFDCNEMRDIRNANDEKLAEMKTQSKSKFKVNSEDTLLETRDIHTFFETNSKEEAMGYFLYKGFVEANIAFENKTNNGFRYFIADENAELNIDFSQISSEEKEKLINLYKENNAEHFQNEERFKKIDEEISIEMGDPYGEYRYEVKGNQMEQNQKDKLSLYIVTNNDFMAGCNEFAFSKEQAYSIAEEMPEMFYNKSVNISNEIIDLIEIKSVFADEYRACDIYQDENIKTFEKKVDDKLIEHICEKFYSGYENCEADQKFFKQNKIAYDDNGFIQKIQAVGDGNWVDIKDFRNVEELEKYFSESKNVKQENEVKQQQPIEKENNKNEEFSFMIKVSPIEEGFDKEIKKFCDEHNLFDKVWQGDEAKHFTRFMSETIDKQVWENAISQNKIPTSKVKLEVNFNSGESVNIDVPLGKRLFENADIQKLISVSQKELSVNKISDETARNWNELMRKNEKGEYVTKVNNHTIENMFNGGMEGLAKSAQSIGDEHLTAFVQGFASAYGFSKVAPTQEKVFDKNAEKQPNLAEKIDNLTQTVTNQSKENSQEKQSKKSSEITQDEMNAIKEETNKVGNEVLNKGKKPKDKNISKPTDISM